MQGAQGIAYTERVPTAEEFSRLRAMVGWSTAARPYVEAALAATRYAICASDAGEAVGMGRVVGDGLYLYLQDVVVVPRCQRQGIGAGIVTRLVAWLRENASPECYLALTTEAENAAFYERLGFRKQTSLVFRLA